MLLATSYLICHWIIPCRDDRVNTRKFQTECIITYVEFTVVCTAHEIYI